MKYLVLFSLFILISCQPSTSIKIGSTTSFTINTLGQPDSIQQRIGIPDVYTNKIIKINIWFYGQDTSIIFANDKIKTIKIKTIKP